MHTIVKSRAMLMCLAVLATASLAACSTNQTPSSAGPDNGQTSPPAATAAASQPAAAPSPTPTGVQNLIVSAAEKSDLTAAFVAYKGIALSDLEGAGPTPGSVYYAYDPAADTYWAMAAFLPSSTASLNVQVGFQDGGRYGMFRKVGAGAWQVETEGIPFYCSEVKYFPPAVLTAWSISDPPGLSC